MEWNGADLVRNGRNEMDVTADAPSATESQSELDPPVLLTPSRVRVELMGDREQVQVPAPSHEVVAVGTAPDGSPTMAASAPLQQASRMHTDKGGR